MRELLTAARMRAIERAAIDSGAVTGAELMERAGAGVVAAVFARWPALRHAPHRAVVLCGPGNNGGDGFVVARHLRDAGWTVEVLLLGDPAALPPDAAANLARWGGDVAPLDEAALRARERAGRVDLYVDAIFGTGLTRPLEGPARDVMTHLAGRNGDDGGGRTVCVDAPSGLCLDSGRLLGFAGQAYVSRNRFAALTVTFDSPKLGHYLAAGPGLCGKLDVVDIGLSDWRWRMDDTGARRKRTGSGPARPAAVTLASPDVDPSDPRFRSAFWPWMLLDKSRDGGHKFDFGHVLVLSGGVGRGGAARMAARAALRVGAGLVTVGCPPVAMIENAARLDAVMLRPVRDAAALTGMLEDARISALCLGPGLGTGEREAALVAAALASGRRAVLDGDALTLLAQRPDLMAALHGRCCLTPHSGEFARLFPDLARKLDGAPERGPAWSKLDAAREAAARCGALVVFKGPDTVIADPSGGAVIHGAAYDRAAPWLATAGTGDTLAGLIAGLLGRVDPTPDVAGMAAWLHVECALSFGPGLIAEDLPDRLPQVFRALGL